MFFLKSVIGVFLHFILCSINIKFS